MCGVNLPVGRYSVRTLSVCPTDWSAPPVAAVFLPSEGAGFPAFSNNPFGGSL